MARNRRSKASAAAAAARSSLRPGSTSRSTVSRAVASSAGSTACRRRAPRVFQLSPVSNSSTCECVTSSAAEPRPASRTLTRAHPGSGVRGGENSSGSAAHAAEHRSAAGQRRSSTKPAHKENANHHTGGVARHNASAPSAAQVRPGQVHS